MARSDTQVNIRIPPSMRDHLRKRAERNRRSVNSEIVYYLDRALASENENGPAEAATSPDHDQNHYPAKNGGIDA